MIFELVIGENVVTAPLCSLSHCLATRTMQTISPPASRALDPAHAGWLLRRCLRLVTTRYRPQQQQPGRLARAIQEWSMLRCLILHAYIELDQHCIPLSLLHSWSACSDLSLCCGTSHCCSILTLEFASHAIQRTSPPSHVQHWQQQQQQQQRCYRQQYGQEFDWPYRSMRLQSLQQSRHHSRLHLHLSRLPTQQRRQHMSFLIFFLLLTQPSPTKPYADANTGSTPSYFSAPWRQPAT